MKSASKRTPEETAMLMERDDRDRAIEALSEMYPKAFFENPRQRRPLKHDIAKDIKKDLAANPDCELRYYDIDDAVAWYTSHVGYYKACDTAGTPRLNLQGAKAGTVTATEAREASERANEIFEQIEDRKEAAKKRALPVSQPTAATAVAAPPKMLTVDTKVDDDTLVAQVESHWATFKTLRSLPDQALQKVLSRTVLDLLINELKTLDARLSA
jgi:sRNA-binding protein